MRFVFLKNIIRIVLEERYGITTVSEDGDDINAIFDHIGALRKIYTTGAEVDYDKVAELIVRDIRS